MGIYLHYPFGRKPLHLFQDHCFSIDFCASVGVYTQTCKQLCDFWAAHQTRVVGYSLPRLSVVDRN